ncbi:MAG: glycosyltransferase family 39 protein [Patescibacteria group bacterium]
MKIISKTSNIFQWLILISIIGVSFGLSLNASLQESAIMDELAHIPAGYGYVKYFDFRLNPEHPPLVKALAALPLLLQSASRRINFPTDSPRWQEDVNGQWAVGAQFLYEYGNDANKIINWSRLGPMLLTILLIIFVYIWASELIGRWWALMPAFLIALSPTILAHGHYVTTDIGATLGIFIATYYFVKLLLRQTKRNYIFAGIAFGIAQLMKFSAVLLIPFFIFLTIVFCAYKIYSHWNEALVERYKKAFISIIKYFSILVSVFAVGFLLVYAVYFIFTVNYPIEKQRADTEFILSSFADGPDTKWETCNLNSDIKISRRVRCLAEINIWMSQNKIFRPLGEYMLGILMVMQRSGGGNTGYFLGEVSAGGWWYYFPVVFILKEPLPSLILIFLALILGIWNIIKNFKIRLILRNIENYIGTHLSEFSMLAFVVFYWLYSIKSPLNIGVRHIMPTMPFIYILTTSAIKKWFNLINADNDRIIRKIIVITSNLTKIVIKSSLIFVLISWYFIEIIFATPYYLSYFNELGGGVNNGYEYVTDSNYDWGQDMKRLKKFVENPPNGEKINKIAVDYFGGASPKYYLGDKFELWWSARGNPIQENIEWLAVSINTIQSALGKLHPGQQRKSEDEYQWLQKIRDPYKPEFKAGTSIFIYKL